jgi:beta-glucosidase
MRRYLLTCCILTMIIVFTSACKPNKNTTERVEKIIGQMTLQEKVELIGGYHSFNIRSYEKYGVPEIRMADGPIGVRNYGPSTAFPVSIVLAASWDRELAQRIGQSIAMEAKAKNVHIMLGPAMNIHRAPYCGRNFEYLGEDPYLAGEIASSFVIGMQNEGVVATAKHYAANNQEFDRNNVSSDMDERTLREIYLPAFEACVKKGKVGAVMTSYNLINGVHCSQNDHIINGILKNEWGFDGIVMSDWTSTYDGVACAIGGLDLEMPSGIHMNPDTLIPAIKAGKFTEEIINEKVRRILMLYERFGFFENPDSSKNFKVDKDLVRKNALDAARGGITLLKNKNNILPLNLNKSLKIAVVGVNADPAITGGGGSSLVIPEAPVSLIDAIEKMAGKNIKVEYTKGLYIEGKLPKDYFKSQQFYTYKGTEKVDGITATFYNNQNLKGNPILEKIYQRLDFSFDDSTIVELPADNFSARFSCYLKVLNKGNYRFALAGDDGYRLFINDKKVLEHWLNQPETVRSVEMVLDKNEEYKIVVEYYEAGGGASIRLGYNESFTKTDFASVMLDEALKLAKKSDVVVIAAGFNNELESEGIDRTFEMPYKQDEFIQKITEANKNCIVVLNSGGNVKMDWLPNIAGLIHAWYPGQEGNLAVAEILFGITNPSGKLPVSFEKKWEDNATSDSYFDDDNDKKVTYSEGVFLGYRHFDNSGIEPLFPFGYGLSYTKFEFSDLRVNADKIKKTEPLIVTFKIKNIGDFDGAEVAQVYVHEQESALPRPVKELKGFLKVYLKKGEQKKVSVQLEPDAFSYFNIDKGGWITEAGKFTILIGNSSKELHLKHEFEIVE